MSVRNDKIRELIVELQECDYDTELEQIFSVYIKESPLGRVKKKFVLKGHSLSFAQKSLNLKNKEKIHKLISALLHTKKSTLSKDELVQAVYGESAVKPTMSPRRRECMNHNIVKLISRTRKLLCVFFGRKEMVWLPCDPMSGGWRLFGFRLLE